METDIANRWITSGLHFGVGAGEQGDSDNHGGGRGFLYWGLRFGNAKAEGWRKAQEPRGFGWFGQKAECI